ncbi:glutamate synthase domain protein [Angomonas deanei]|uniref:Iron-binding zinc finger CDGSH type, putative n=1 Tax=Angomonas deanei TaxID=59799 RepID=A0A7G2C480_9TRYP|nr:glutamate synthase domain protein [Angomonas deanei]CAD2214510.1 Iron-binding zinc finger CDGSH type, putative [Angomonas deanei]|eukprot:EPY33169.1 glutamate synthase domain protein [Angomonas deanei]
MFNRSRVALQFWKSKVDPYAPKKIAAIPQKKPYYTALEKDKEYYWCTCGLSAKQPFCDGAHKKYNEKHNTELKPLKFKADATGKKLLCGCKNTEKGPYCDLSHIGVIFRTAVGIDKDPKP